MLRRPDRNTTASRMKCVEKKSSESLQFKLGAASGPGRCASGERGRPACRIPRLAEYTRPPKANRKQADARCAARGRTALRAGRARSPNAHRYFSRQPR